MANLWALEWVEEVRPGKIIICSNSTAALRALKGGKSGARPDLIVEIMTVGFFCGCQLTLYCMEGLSVKA